MAIMVLGPATSPAFAEVMDKEMSVPGVWAWSIVGALAGYFGARARWWIGIVTLPVAILGPLGALVEFRDPFVGPAIAAEAGSGYGAHALGALVVVVGGHVAGWWRRARETRRRS